MKKWIQHSLCLKINLMMKMLQVTQIGYKGSSSRLIKFRLYVKGKLMSTVKGGELGGQWRPFIHRLFFSFIIFNCRDYTLTPNIFMERRIYIFPLNQMWVFFCAAQTGQGGTLLAGTLPTHPDPTPNCCTKASWWITTWSSPSWWELWGILISLSKRKQTLVFKLWNSYRFMQMMIQNASLISRVHSFCTKEKKINNDFLWQDKEQQFSVYFHFGK